LGVSIGANVIDYGIGEHSDKGIDSRELAFIVGGIIAAIGITASFAAAVAATAIGGIILGAAVNHFFDIDLLKQHVVNGFAAWDGIDQNIRTLVDIGVDRAKEAVANATNQMSDGLSAWGGIYENAKTITNVGADRAVETIRNTVDHVVNAGKQAVETVSETIGDFSEKVADSANEVVETMTSTLQQVGQGVSNVIGQASEKVTEFLGSLFGGNK
jgi:hypothetical protein